MAAVDSAAQWWATLQRRVRYVHAVVVGPRRSGKTTWFRRLEERTDGEVVLWDVVGVARARSVDEVWAACFGRLGVKATGDDPIADLEAHLDGLGHGLILVVDDWDAAVDGRGRPVSDHCYEVLDELTRFCLGQAMTRGDAPCLGLVLLTSLLDARDIEYFTRKARRPTFERLSKLVSRSFAIERFPSFDAADSAALLVGEGVPADAAAEVAAACGGWPWLLLEAAAAVRGHGGWTAEAIAEVRDRRLPGLLEASVVPCVAARPEVELPGLDPIDHLTQRLAAGAAPAEFGLPHRFDDDRRPAELVRQLLTRVVLVVDIENVRMPFQRHFEVAPQGYRDGLIRFLQDRFREWVQQLRADHEVADEDVWLVGRSQERIDETVGRATPGLRLYPPPALRDKARRAGGDSSDDMLMIAQVTERATRNPLGRFVIASGDADGPLILDLVVSLRQVTVCTPWDAPAKLRPYLPAPGRIRDNTFPARRPREVTEAELRAARQRRRESGGGRT